MRVEEVPDGPHEFVDRVVRPALVYARFTFDQTLESFLRGHVEAFADFGGVPRRILYDNLKSVVIERLGTAVRFNPALLEFAGSTTSSPSPARRPPAGRRVVSRR